MSLKRLWDTENKKIVWAIPTGDPHTKLQVWTNDDGSKLYVYDSSKWVELANPQTHDVETYGPVWKALDDETVGYYLTNVPTDLYNWDSGDEVAYRFMNGTTVLQSGKVDEGETPEYTGDTPTKEATAQYTYTFSGWKPTVGPISKKTDFKAQFDSTVNEYDVTIESNNTDYGTVDVAFVEGQPYGTAISVEDNVLTIGETEITATAETGYEFDTWGELPATVTGDLTITATFKVVMHTVAFDLYNAEEVDPVTDCYIPGEDQDPLRGSISPASVQVPHGYTFTSQEGESGNIIFHPQDWDGEDMEDESLIIVPVTPNTGYAFETGYLGDIVGISDNLIVGNVSDFPIAFFEVEPAQPGE